MHWTAASVYQRKQVSTRDHNPYISLTHNHNTNIYKIDLLLEHYYTIPKLCCHEVIVLIRAIKSVIFTYSLLFCMDAKLTYYYKTLTPLQSYDVTGLYYEIAILLKRYITVAQRTIQVNIIFLL